MLEANIILELQSTSSRLEKEAIIIREFRNNNKALFDGFKFAYDKLITFGVNEKTVPHHLDESCVVDDVDFSEFVEVLYKLIRRDVTGNSAKALLDNLCKRTSYATWNMWYRRILVKDLKCGVSETTINKCVSTSSSYYIPTFSCQLAFDSNKHESKVVGEKIIECKLDGSRVLTIVYPEGKVDQFSRNGKEIVNFQLIKDQFLKISKTLSQAMVFDGEIMSSSFQDLMTQFYRKDNVNTDDAILYIFDMLPLEDFKKGICTTPQISRTKDLHSWYDINKESIPNVKILKFEILNLSKESDKKIFENINRKALDEGYEGIMIKDLNSSYECKRSTAWLKLKPTITVDLQIVDLQEGEDKYKNKLGALICTGFDDGKEIFVNVGSGLTDDERVHYWNDRENIIGKIAEIKADAITKNQNGTYSLRFPRFVRLRGFNINEKI